METSTGAVDGLMQGATGGPHVEEATTHHFFEYIVTGVQYFGGPNTNTDYFGLTFLGTLKNIDLVMPDPFGCFFG